MKEQNQTTQGPTLDGGTTQIGPMPALTIACHPNLDRVGERALLFSLGHGLKVKLGRTTPDFSQPGSVLGAPLEDPHLSRSPVFLQTRGDGGVLVDRGSSPMRLRVGGEVLGERQALSVEECEAGVDLEFGERVVLVLHMVTDADEPVASSFGLIGESNATRATRVAVARVADLDVPVLLRGESGTGKELVARAIHEHGKRRKRPFVGVNLSAVPSSLAAAELFGTVKGAYTGAVTAHKGFFRAADGGTLFLDEVGECPADVQTTLLRALETSEVYPVGSDVAQQVDVRLVAATDSDLESKARSGTFKEPLLHRLAAYEIWLPPLRERRDDIGRLIVHFADQILQEIGIVTRPGQAQGTTSPWIPAELVARLVRYRWPGNVRQLRNLIWQLVIDSRGKERLESGPRLQRMLEAANEGESAKGPPSTSARGRRPGEVTEAELVAAMQQSRWDVAAAARFLGVARSSMYELIRRCEQLRTAEELGAEEIDRALEEADGDVDGAAGLLQVSVRGLRRRMKRTDEW